MKAKLALVTLLASLSTHGFAADVLDANGAVKCPDISELKAAKFTNANSVYDTNLWKVGSLSNQYGTKNAWQFTFHIEADDKDGAIKNAATALTSIRLINGPEKIDNAWMCHYRSGQHDAVAIMSVPDNGHTVASADEKVTKKEPA